MIGITATEAIAIVFLIIFIICLFILGIWIYIQSTDRLLGEVFDFPLAFLGISTIIFAVALTALLIVGIFQRCGVVI